LEEEGSGGLNLSPAFVVVKAAAAITVGTVSGTGAVEFAPHAGVKRYLTAASR